ncbi:MAG: hypothetical protein IPL35_06990 [Sphingobacteriales bacterium]|nr:hypothetical protein [Sphingobacteriales bacterium]
MAKDVNQSVVGVGDEVTYTITLTKPRSF